MAAGACQLHQRDDRTLVSRLRLVDEHAAALARGRSGKVQRVIAMAGRKGASTRRQR